MPLEEITIDARNQPLGRLSTRIATILRGKHRADFDPTQLPGTQVTVTNASRLRLTGKKLQQKRYYRFSGYPGGLKSTSLATEFARSPERVVRHAVAHMLPNNKLRAQLLKRLKVTK